MKFYGHMSHPLNSMFAVADFALQKWSWVIERMLSNSNILYMKPLTEDFAASCSRSWRKNISGSQGAPLYLDCRKSALLWRRSSEDWSSIWLPICLDSFIHSFIFVVQGTKLICIQGKNSVTGLERVQRDYTHCLVSIQLNFNSLEPYRFSEPTRNPECRAQ